MGLNRIIRTALVCALAPSLGFAAPVPEKPPVITKVPPLNLMIKYPDLVVSDLHVTTRHGIGAPMMDTIYVSVKEMCGVKTTKQYHLTVQVASEKGGAVLLQQTFGSALGGMMANGTESWSVPISAYAPGKSIPAKSFVRVDVDVDNAIVEDVETNNYRQLNPNEAPFPPNAATYCKAHAPSEVPNKP